MLNQAAEYIWYRTLMLLIICEGKSWTDEHVQRALENNLQIII